MTLTCVLWKWSVPVTRTAYTAEHVNVLARSIRRHYEGPIRIVCLTDDAHGITECETDELWDDFAKVADPFKQDRPGCYRRLRIFSAEMRERFGPRIVSVDLDSVVTGNLNALWDRPEPFVGWRVTNGAVPRVYNGSMFLFDAGSLAEIWDTFDPDAAAGLMRDAGYIHGTDQCWMAYVLPKDLPHWTAADGVLSWRLDGLKRGAPLPADARIVFFHGPEKPWDDGMPGWVKEHWR